ncbi:MAG TPA: arginase family protein [Balneolaceae bacterium]
MKISLLQVPWDSGYYGKRMGRGPIHLVEQGLVEHLKSGNHHVELTEITFSDSFITEASSAKVLNSKLSESVQNVRNEDRFPIILAGNCNTAIGTIAGLKLTQPGVIWFDAHADFNTPDTTSSGFFDGMALSILTGNSWKQWRKTIPGFTPVSEQNVILIGARSFDSEEQKLLNSSGTSLIQASDIHNNQKAALSQSMQSLSQNCKELYLHIDLDVFDPTQLKANEFSANRGLLLVEMQEVLKGICANFSVAAISFNSYNPTSDSGNQGPKIVKSILDTVLPMVN